MKFDNLMSCFLLVQLSACATPRSKRLAVLALAQTEGTDEF